MSNRDRHRGDPKRAIGVIVGIMSVGLLVAAALAKQRSRKDREGHEGPTGDFKMPEDMRAVIPEPPSYAPA